MSIYKKIRKRTMLGTVRRPADRLISSPDVASHVLDPLQILMVKPNKWRDRKVWSINWGYWERTLIYNTTLDKIWRFGYHMSTNGVYQFLNTLKVWLFPDPASIFFFFFFGLPELLLMTTDSSQCKTWCLLPRNIKTLFEW